MIGIIFSGKDGVHDLAHNHQRRIAGVVINVLQTDIDCIPVIIWKHLDLVSGSAESRLNQIKVDR